MSEKRYLLIPAAGVGERMKIGYPKQYFPIASGRTMLEVTVNRLSEMGFFDQIAVVVSEQDSYIDQCRFAGDVLVLRCGGQTRAQSVLNGLKAWALPDDAWVFVHDAARPRKLTGPFWRCLSPIRSNGSTQKESLSARLIARTAVGRKRLRFSDEAR